MREQDCQAVGTTRPENSYDDGGYNDDDYQSIHRMEHAADHVEAVHSPDSGSGPGPSTQRRSICLNASTLTPRLAMPLV